MCFAKQNTCQRLGRPAKRALPSHYYKVKRETDDIKNKVRCWIAIASLSLNKSAFPIGILYQSLKNSGSMESHIVRRIPIAKTVIFTYWHTYLSRYFRFVNLYHLAHLKIICFFLQRTCLCYNFLTYCESISIQLGSSIPENQPFHSYHYFSGYHFSYLTFLRIFLPFNQHLL